MIRFGRGVLAEAAPLVTERATRVLVVRSASVAAAEELGHALREFAEVLEITARGEPSLQAIEADAASALLHRIWWWLSAVGR